MLPYSGCNPSQKSMGRFCCFLRRQSFGLQIQSWFDSTARFRYLLLISDEQDGFSITKTIQYYMLLIDDGRYIMSRWSLVRANFSTWSLVLFFIHMDKKMSRFVCSSEISVLFAQFKLCLASSQLPLSLLSLGLHIKVKICVCLINTSFGYYSLLSQSAKKTKLYSKQARKLLKSGCRRCMCIYL
jgi:hypothetical protein